MKGTRKPREKRKWRRWRGMLAGTNALGEHLREHAQEVAGFESDDAAPGKGVQRRISPSFADLAGDWEDERSTEEILRDIEDNRHGTERPAIE